MTLPNRPGYSVQRNHAVPVNGTKPLPTNPPEPPTHLPLPSNPLLPGHISSVSPIHPLQIIQQSQIWSHPCLEIPPTNVDDEIQQKKAFIRNHRLLPSVLALLSECKKEGLVGQINPEVIPSYFFDPREYSLDDFLESQGISPNDLETQSTKDPRISEFLFKFEQLKQRYKEELEKLDRVCLSFCDRLVALLREQSHFRPVTEHEIQLKLGELHRKFDSVRLQLKNSVCNAIQMLQRHYHQPKKKRRQLSKQATEILNNWFYQHINDPYPTEEEKNILASKCLLSINQINNWFGNKRIRNKRKNAKLNMMKSISSGNVSTTGSSQEMQQNSEESSSFSEFGGEGDASVSSSNQQFDTDSPNPKRIKTEQEFSSFPLPQHTFPFSQQPVQLPQIHEQQFVPQESIPLLHQSVPLPQQQPQPQPQPQQQQQQPQQQQQQQQQQPQQQQQQQQQQQFQQQQQQPQQQFQQQQQQRESFPFSQQSVPLPQQPQTQPQPPQPQESIPLLQQSVPLP